MQGAALRRGALHRRELRQGDARTIQAYLIRRAADGLEPLRERFRTRQHQRDKREELLHFAEILRLMRARHHVRAVEGDKRGPLPPLQERAQMHAGVPEINVHQIRAPPPKKLHELLHLAPVIERRNPLDELQIKAPQ